MRTRSRGQSCCLIAQLPPGRPSCGVRSCAALLAAVLALFSTATSSRAVPLTHAAFGALAAKCAPGISPTVLEAVAAKESRFDPLALHNNTRKLTRVARTEQEGIELAKRWIGSGDSVDIGLMQINAPNLAPLGLTVADGFKPCFSLAAGAATLRSAYNKGASESEQQAALLIMLSRYNTGKPLNGLVNGYVEDIVAGAKDLRAPTEPPAPLPQDQIPTWDIWRSAAFARTHGATWLVDLTPAPSIDPNAKPQPQTP